MKVTGNVKYIPAGVTQYIVDGNDGEINVDTSSNAVTIVLPNIINSGYANSDKGFIINDISSNAGTNNITIVASNNTVNSQSSVLISANGGTAKCSIASMNEWFIVTEPVTSGMSGNLTPNYIPKAATSSTLNDSVIYQNSGRIGIGTTNPLTNLHVSGTNSAAGIISSRYSSDANAPGFGGMKARGTEASPSQVLSGDSMLTITAFGYTSGGAFSTGTGRIMFYATENFTASAQGTAFKISTTPIGAAVDVFNFGINDNGDVSIGDTSLSPTARLYVKGIDSTSSNYALKVNNSASSPLFSVRNDGNIYIGSLLGSYKMNMVTDVSNMALFETSQNLGYVVLNAVTNPTYRLLLNSVYAAEFGQNSSGTYIDKNGTLTLGSTNTGGQWTRLIGSGTDIYIGQSAFSRFGYASAACSFIEQDANTPLGIGTYTNNELFLFTNATRQVTILGSGNVGLGIAVPTAKSHIQGIDATSSNYALKVDNSASSAILYVRNDGFVSINQTTSGAARLEITGGAGAVQGIYVQTSGSIAFNSNDSTGIANKAETSTGTAFRANLTSTGYALDLNYTPTNKTLLRASYNGSAAILNTPFLPTSNAGLATGDLYIDTAAQILANGDKVVGWKV